MIFHSSRTLLYRVHEYTPRVTSGVMRLCVPFLINLYLWHEIVVFRNKQKVFENNTFFSSLSKKMRWREKTYKIDIFFVYHACFFYMQGASYLYHGIFNFEIHSCQKKQWLLDFREQISRPYDFLWWKKTPWIILTSIWDAFILFPSSGFCFQNWMISIIVKRNFQIFMIFLRKRSRASFENGFIA